MSKLVVFNSIQEIMQKRDLLPAGTTVGFVPTMGALHDGHTTLIKKSAAENQVTVLSVFVNPTQFSNAEDLEKYPRTFAEDIAAAESAGANWVLNPNYNEMYSDNYRYQLTENDFSKKLCGAHRPGHFNGVLTVVMKLLQIVRPTKAYFGEKDFQQLRLIQDMAKTFFLRSEIVACPTIRESSGLAMSSRNKRLTPQGREKAPALYKALKEFSGLEECKQYLKSAGIEVEYLEEHYNRRFIAAYIDGVRLIDNVEL